MEKTDRVNGKSFFYRLYGKGHPVVLLHGFGETGDVWKHQWEYLQSRFTVIVPDLPGSGYSDLITDMSMEGMAAAINSLLETEIPLPSEKKITLTGHSMGGYIALAFAEKYPEKLNGLGLFHSSAFADSEEKRSVRQKGIEFIKAHGAFAFLKTTTPNLFSPETNEHNSDLVQTFIERLNNFKPESLVSYYEAMMARPDRTAVLKKSDYPVLFIIGEHDKAVPKEDALKQTHLPAEAEIHILKKSAHMGMLEETEKVNRILEKFLATTYNE